MTAYNNDDGFPRGHDNDVDVIVISSMNTSTPHDVENDYHMDDAAIGALRVILRTMCVQICCSAGRE
jgi:hypothetical protein